MRFLFCFSWKDRLGLLSNGIHSCRAILCVMLECKYLPPILLFLCFAFSVVYVLFFSVFSFFFLFFSFAIILWRFNLLDFEWLGARFFLFWLCFVDDLNRRPIIFIAYRLVGGDQLDDVYVFLSLFLKNSFGVHTQTVFS